MYIALDKSAKQKIKKQNNGKWWFYRVFKS
jgi:hypothetical protein